MQAHCPRLIFACLVLLTTDLILLVRAGETAASEDRWLPFEISIGGPGEDAGTDVAVDSQGNIVVCGTTDSRVWLFNGEHLPRQGAGFVVKLADDGRPLWAASHETACVRLAVDRTGHILVAGAGRNLSVVSKFDPQGRLQWSRQIEGGHAGGIAVDKRGCIVVAGQCRSELVWQKSTGGRSSNEPVRAGEGYRGGGQMDSFVCRLGPGGELLWMTYPGGVYDDAATDVAVDDEDNVVVAGYSSSPGWVRGGTTTRFVEGSSNGFVLKLGADGSPVWSSFLGLNRAKALDADRLRVLSGQGGTIYVCGFMECPGISESGFIDTLSESGGRLWCAYDLPADCRPTNRSPDLALDRAGSLVLMNLNGCRYENNGVVFLRMHGTSGTPKEVLRYLDRVTVPAAFAFCPNRDVVVTGFTRSLSFAPREEMGNARHDVFVVRILGSRLDE